MRGGRLAHGRDCLRPAADRGDAPRQRPDPVLDLQRDGSGELAAIAYRPRNADGAVITIGIAGPAEG